MVVSEGVAALGAAGGGLLMPADDALLSVPGTVGYADELVAQIRAERRDAPLPAAVALRTGEADLAGVPRGAAGAVPRACRSMEPTTVSMCAVPLRWPDASSGRCASASTSPRLFDDDERRFVEALAAQTALALDRSRCTSPSGKPVTSPRRQPPARPAAPRHGRPGRGEHRARRSPTLSSPRPPGPSALIVTALCVIEGEDTLRVIGMRRRADDPRRSAGRPSRFDADLPASEAARTGNAVVMRRPRSHGGTGSRCCVATSPQRRGERQRPGHRRATGPSGALSLTFPAPVARSTRHELELLCTIGRQCGVALERARLFAAERAARERSAFLAEATSLLGSSLDPVETLRHLTDVLVPRLGDWAVVYLKTGPTARRARRRGAPRSRTDRDDARAAARQHPWTRAPPGGLAEVLRTGRSLQLRDGAASTCERA